MNHLADPSKQHYTKKWDNYLLLRTDKISVKSLLNVLRDNNEKTWKILVSFGQLLLNNPLVWYCIELIHTNPNNQNWNDNKSALMIPLVFFPSVDWAFSTLI